MVDFAKKTAPAALEKPPAYKGPVSFPALEEIFSLCDDFTVRRLDVGLAGRIFVRACWLDALVSGNQVTEEVLRPLTDRLRGGDLHTEDDCLTRLLSGGVTRCTVHRRSDMDLLVADLCHGACAILFEGCDAALSFEVVSQDKRAVGEPTLEKSLKGGKDAFTESLQVNCSLVRRRLASPQLKLTVSSLGRCSGTRVGLLFLEGRADPAVLAELARRLDRLDPDALLALGPLEAGVVDAPSSPFPQLLHTERPDRFASYLAEGKIGLLVDGIPLGLVLPVSLACFLKGPDDAGAHPLVAASLALLRNAALLLALLLPGFYVAITMYHQEMLPTRLLLSLVEAERDLPFSTALEVLGMLGTFALLQEAGLRLPDPVGDTVSVIGALIVGQAAVEARLISPFAIIVVAFSGISCYALPSQDLSAALRLARLALVLGAALAGLYGVTLLLCPLLLHLTGIDSFGADYTGAPGGRRTSRLSLSSPAGAQALRGAGRRPLARRRSG